MLLAKHPFFPAFFNIFLGLPVWGFLFVTYPYQLITSVADGDELLDIGKAHFPRLFAVYLDALMSDKHTGTVLIENINGPACRDEAG